MSETAFIVRVPVAEEYVRELRERFDSSARLGVPAHITVLYPFMSPERITPAVIEQAGLAVGEILTFSFTLAKVARFPGTAYLAPEPPEPFIALTEALVRRFPDFPAFRGEHPAIVPHLTVANGNASVVEEAVTLLEGLLKGKGPIHGACASVALLESSSGMWREMCVFGLRQHED